MKKTKKRTGWVAVLMAVAICGGLTVLVPAWTGQEPEPTEQPTETTLPLPSAVPQSPLTQADFREQDGFLTCDGAEIALGIDVSKYQGEIDWALVKAAGVEFVMVRLGYRSYGDGVLHPDPMAQANLEGARAAGLQVGAYFYSQAVSVAEAQEEAAYALEILGDFALDLPLSFDWEIEARTENVTVDTATACADAFCRAVRAAGLEPMLYFNAYQATERLDLRALTGYRWWLAMYDWEREFPCRFDFWQYTQSGSVPGIEGAVDINVMVK